MSNNKLRKVQGNDSFHRMNYLYQMSKYMALKDSTLSAYYGNLIINVAKKSVLKLHPDIKRLICKKCRGMMVYNKTAKAKIVNKNKAKIIEWTCQICSTKKKIPISVKKDNLIWVEKVEAILEEIY